MKKLFIFFSILLAGFFVACDEDLEIWDSETLDYAGRWHFKVQEEDGTLLKEYGSHTIRTFNSAANVEDELWVEDVNGVLDFKVKFNIEGDFAEFQSVDQTEEGSGENVVSFPQPGSDPDGEGATATIPDYFNKAAILEGKVLEEAGTSKSGAPVDSIYLKIHLFAGEVEYSSEYDESTMDYVWDEGSFSYYSEPDSVVILSGTRYTGFEEDEY